MVALPSGSSAVTFLSVPHATVRAAAVDEDGVVSGKGQQLWKRELRSSDELMTDFDSFDGEIGRSMAMERDIERLAKKEEIEKLVNGAPNASRDGATGDQGRGGVVRDIVDKVLVADFFFILFSLTWLFAGLLEQAALDSSILIDSWLPLWPLVFQPALGIFMAGAVMSALTKKL